uniref:YTP1 n=2 Tax=Kalmanozyma brasiliensis (strain GHG001) TaxID=1365824 RepID=V5F2Q8_KALBG
MLSSVQAHEHHQHGPADTSVPIDSILWIHIAIQTFAWFALFPLAMVLGMVRHRLHVPVATTSLALTVGGYFLGHGHGGRSFPHTAHGTMASLLVFYLAAQTALGVYLKLHLPEKRLRPKLVLIHGILGKSFPIVGWVQMVFGVSTLQSWCFGGHLGQCLAHYIMGSAFQAYAAILVIMMKAGGDWLSRRGQSQEWFDSWVIMLWGIVNTFTEHHGGPWTHKDLQHTLMGVLWWAGGAVGIWLSRGGRRNVFPAIIIALTGWAMSAHSQELMISTMVHSLFGYALMGAGIARMIEVCFVLQDRPTGSTAESPDAAVASNEAVNGSWYPIRAFQYLPPYLLVASGVLFMSATDEELRWADARGVDHATWGLIDFSASMLMFFWINVLVDLYVGYGGRYGAAKRNAALARGGDGEAQASSALYARLSLGNGHEGARQKGETIALRSTEQSHALKEAGVKRVSDELEPSHVLFDEEDEDSFVEKERDDYESSGSGSGSGSAQRSRVRN